MTTCSRRYCSLFGLDELLSILTTRCGPLAFRTTTDG